MEGQRVFHQYFSALVRGGGLTASNAELLCAWCAETGEEELWAAAASSSSGEVLDALVDGALSSGADSLGFRALEHADAFSEAVRSWWANVPEDRRWEFIQRAKSARQSIALWRLAGVEEKLTVIAMNRHVDVPVDEMAAWLGELPAPIRVSPVPMRLMGLALHVREHLNALVGAADHAVLAFVLTQATSRASDPHYLFRRLADSVTEPLSSRQTSWIEAAFSSGLGAIAAAGPYLAAVFDADAAELLGGLRAGRIGVSNDEFGLSMKGTIELAVGASDRELARRLGLLPVPLLASTARWLLPVLSEERRCSLAHNLLVRVTCRELAAASCATLMGVLGAEACSVGYHRTAAQRELTDGSPLLLAGLCDDTLVGLSGTLPLKALAAALAHRPAASSRIFTALRDSGADMATVLELAGGWSGTLNELLGAVAAVRT